MTCKDDCLYSPVCRLPFNTSETQVEFAQVCHHFKNKADFVEVKRGHWEVCSDEYEICASEFVCSVCKESFVSSELTDEQFFEMMKYCANCGAKMVD